MQYLNSTLYTRLSEALQPQSTTTMLFEIIGKVAMVIKYNPLLKDTSLKRTPRVGHCFSLLFSVDSLKDGHSAAFKGVRLLLETVDCDTYELLTKANLNVA